MISRLDRNQTLFHLALHFLHNLMPHSWFTEIRLLCQKYRLPEPLVLLTSPPNKAKFKLQTKSAVISFWHKKLCAEVSEKLSLKFLRCNFILLGRSPHLIWTSSRGSPTRVKAATLQAKILCGTYRSDALLSKWTGDTEACSLPSCSASVGDIVHLLSGSCPALKVPLEKTVLRGLNTLLPYPFLYNFTLSALSKSPLDWAIFIADPSTEPEIIFYRQENGDKSIYPLMQFARSFICTMHRTHFHLRGLSYFLR